MSVDPKPAVGGIVHHCGSGNSKTGERSRCRAALITEVYEQPAGDWVSLTVFHPLGQAHHPKVPYESELPDHYSDETGEHASTWHWPERV